MRQRTWGGFHRLSHGIGTADVPGAEGRCCVVWAAPAGSALEWTGSGFHPLPAQFFLVVVFSFNLSAGHPKETLARCSRQVLGLLLGQKFPSREGISPAFSHIQSCEALGTDWKR